GIARLIDSYADGLIDKGEFEPRIARMRERLKQIEAQAQQVKDEASLERELTLILGRLDEFASRVKHGLHAADWLTRREIIRALVKRVEIDQEQVRVVFRVNPPPQAPRLPSEQDAQSLHHCGRRDYSSLGYPTEGSVERPVLYVSSIQEFSHQVEKSAIMDALAECVEQHLMVEFVEALRDISLDEPGAPPPLVVDFPQCGVTSPFRPKAV